MTWIGEREDVCMIKPRHLLGAVLVLDWALIGSAQLLGIAIECVSPRNFDDPPGVYRSLIGYGLPGLGWTALVVGVLFLVIPSRRIVPSESPSRSHV